MQSILRRQIYWLLIIVAVGIAASRIVSAQRVYEPAMATDGRMDDWRGRWPEKRPKPAATYSSNDRSRWATVRALVDEGTYVVGTRDCRQVVYSAIAPLAGGNALETAILVEAGYLVRTKNNDLFQRIGPKPYEQLPDHGIIFEDGWESIDRVLKPTPVLGADGTPDHWEFYSSKPPLLATLMAGLYWLLQQLTGWTLASNYVEVVRVLLLIVHPLPFALYLWILGRMVERYGRTDWGRFYVMTAGCFATLMPAFLNTFNNHTLGTFSVLFALYSVTEIWRAKTPLSTGTPGERDGGEGAKPPDDGPSCLGVSPFTPAPLPRNTGGEGLSKAVWHHYFLAGLFAAFAVANELPALSFACALGLLLLCWSPTRTLCFFLPPALLIAAAFLGTNYLAVGQFRPAYSEFGGPPPFKREVLGDLSQQEKGSPWYQYEGSHWLKPVVGQSPRHGIDWARYYEDRWTYAFHLLIGHHGFFSLTPIWLLAFAGIALALWKRNTALPWFMAPLTLAVSAVVIGFYLVMSENYGGFAVAPRWLIWLSPLLLLCLLPVADVLADCRWKRALALLLLGASAFSAFYSNWNPWRHPWLFDLLEWLGWVSY
jgi:hypothetical protein